jgi:hypothetical protein
MPLQQSIPGAQQTGLFVPGGKQDTNPGGHAPQVWVAASWQICPAGQQIPPHTCSSGQHEPFTQRAFVSQQTLPQHTLKGGQQRLLPSQKWLGGPQQFPLVSQPPPGQQTPLQTGCPGGQQTLFVQTSPALQQMPWQDTGLVPAQQTPSFEQF